MKALIVVLALASQAFAQIPDSSTTGRAREIVMRHIDAIGGLSAYSAVQSAHIVFRQRYPIAGLEMHAELWTTKPNLAYMVTRSDVGVIEAGFDGKVYWTITPGEGARILTRPPDLLNDAVYDPYEALARYDVRYVGRRERGGKTLDALELIAGDGQLYTQYFDTESGLFVRLDVGNPSSPVSTMKLDRYRKFGDLLYATVMTTKIGDANEYVARITRVDHKPIDPKRYELPDAVRGLAARKP